MRTPRPKQPVNPVPEPGTRWVCEPRAKDAPADGTAPPPRIVIITRVRFDDDRKDTRIEYANEATKRNGATWYETFKSGAEFKPAPPKEAQPAPVALPATQGQVPLMLGYRPTDPALLAVLGRIAMALERVVGLSNEAILPAGIVRWGMNPPEPPQAPAPRRERAA